VSAYVTVVLTTAPLRAAQNIDSSQTFAIVARSGDQFALLATDRDVPASRDMDPLEYAAKLAAENGFEYRPPVEAIVFNLGEDGWSGMDSEVCEPHGVKRCRSCDEFADARHSSPYFVGGLDFTRALFPNGVAA
jgi:hypothetical protein